MNARSEIEQGDLDSDPDQRIRRSIRARYRKERRFRRFGAISIAIGIAFLVWLLGVSAMQASSAFVQTYIALDIQLDADEFDAQRTPESIANAPYSRFIKASLRADFPDADTRKAKRALYKLVSDGAEYALRDAVADDPSWIDSGERRRIWVLAGGEVDLLMKGRIDRASPESARRLSDRALVWIDSLRADGRIEKRFNRPLFTAGDSRNAEEAGILGAVVGSLLTMIATMLLSLPVGIAAAVYLQEFAPRNRMIDLVEVNINNLAAVPSIIFGLLGLAVLINFFGFTRSAPLVGGMVLALMTLPTIIISSRAALASVPPRIRQAALGVGASRVQCVIHHVLPLAMPGMLTGAIIGLARALGETAPLLAIGMVAFIVDVPSGMNDPATVLPVQIYLWADSPERGFVERTAAAIIVLLVVLVAINGLVALLRTKLEKRW